LSFLKKLFGGGGSQSSGPKFDAVEHDGHLITPQPMPENGQFRLQATVSKEVSGETREHRLIRADVFPSAEQAAEFAIRKAKLLIDQQGDRLYS